MAPKIFSSALSKSWLSSIELIATDMDGTLTREGKFAPRLLERLEGLSQRGLPVLIVTGRSAGWVSGLVEYLPITGAIAENGGVFYSPACPQGHLLEDTDPTFRERLSEVFQQLKQHYPDLEPSADNPFRITDWTFDRKDLEIDELQPMEALCQQLGWAFTYSSIQCHIKLPQQSKQQGLLKALEVMGYPSLSPRQILTLGDSPNDAALLDHQVFPHSVGVRNIQPYLETMSAQPQWVSQQDELDGFLEVTEAFLALESHR